MVRRAMKVILWTAFDVHCREPDRGFDATFKKHDTAENLWWVGRPREEVMIQMDFLAHVLPLTTLRAVNSEAMADLQYAMVYPSSAVLIDNEAGEAAPPAAAGQRILVDSPEKPQEEDVATLTETLTLQYVVCEITHGGKASVSNKLEQLEKDCFFLTSRAQPHVRNASDLRVLDAVAIAIVASPSLNQEGVFENVARNRAKFTMLSALLSAGRLVCVRDKRTISARLEELERLISINAEEQQRAIEEQRRAGEEQRRASEEQQRAIEEQRRAGEEQRRASEEQRRASEEQRRAMDELKEKFDDQNALINTILSILTANKADPLPATDASP
jgi:hypothetical protein